VVVPRVVVARVVVVNVGWRVVGSSTNGRLAVAISLINKKKLDYFRKFKIKVAIGKFD